MSTQPGRHEKEQNMRNWNRTKKAIAAAALVATGFGGGAAVMLTGAASAETTASTNRSDEEALSGDALDEVTAAVEAEYPGATIERAETDSDGVYEAHIATADGDELTVELDDSYAITGTETHHGRGDHGGHGNEEALTGDALDQVTAAVEAEYPGATIERAETDSDGIYEAHITTADGDDLTVELDDSYAITGAESR
jgi:uncharacterized membrane protein YkoI